MKAFKKITALFMAATLSCAFSGCGSKKANYTPVSGLDTDKNITLKIAIPYETNKALNTVANDFMSKYPNVNITLSYVENYDTNAVKLFKENSVDMIFGKGVTFSEETVKDADGNETPTGKTTDDYYYDFAADDEIDFSDTAPEITNNFRHTRLDENGNEITYQYCYPLGGEMRGLFVNVSFLNSLGLSVPTNYSEFISCCEAIKKAGYIPVQGNITTLSYGLGLAQAVNTVTHTEEGLQKMSQAEEGTSEYFADVLDKLCTLSEKRYVDYKAVEETDYFGDISELGQARSFLGLLYNKNTLETIKPENNTGYTAFFPYLSSTETVISDLIKENNLDTEFQFICSPLNDSGNAPAYITPYYGICANKQSENLIWIREFINFLFDAENEKTYAENATIIPNTTDALDYACEKYHLNKDTDITLCGQILFSASYNGFTPVSNWLITVLKGNAQKYMVKLNKDADGNIIYETDESGNEFLYLGNGKTVISKEYIGEEDGATPGYAFCTKAYYLNELESEFAKFRVN